MTTPLGALLIPGALLIVLLAAALLRLSVHTLGAGRLSYPRALVGAVAILAGQAGVVGALLAVSPSVALVAGLPLVIVLAVGIVRMLTATSGLRSLLIVLLQGLWLVAAGTLTAGALGAIWAAAVHI